MAVTVTYSFKIPAQLTYVTGTTIPPTAAQAAAITRIAALVNFGADTDTTATLTHNWSFSASQLAEIRPVVMLTPQTLGTAEGFYSAQLASANYITISKGATTAGSGETTLMVQMFYPNTLID